MRIAVILLILFFNCICLAQSPQLSDLHFNRLSIKNGLPIDAIFTTLQDKEGYMWIGTQAGLVRYDGYTCKVYQFGLETPLYAAIPTIYEDRAGELWVGTLYKGLYHYKRETDTFIHYTNNPNEANRMGSGAIISMHDDSKGNLWLLSSDGFNFRGYYISQFDTKKHQFKNFGILEKGSRFINASIYYNISEDHKGRIWIGTNNGIYEYAPAGKKFIPHFASTDSLQQKVIVAQQEDATHPGVIWMSIFNTKLNKGEGLWRYNTADNTIEAYHHFINDSTSLGNDSVYTIQKDILGNMWFNTASGLSVFEHSSKQFFNYNIKDKKLNFNDFSTRQLKEDNVGNFWCFNGSNLLSFNTKTKTFKQYIANEKEPDALASRNIFHLLIDRSGMPWISAYEGLYWLNRKRSSFITYKNIPGQPHYFPGGGNTSFAEDKDGTFWIWCSKGLYHWYPSSDSFMLIKAMTYNEDLRSATITNKYGTVWCGTFGKGLYSYNTKTKEIRVFKNNPKDSISLSSNYVTTIYEDNKAVLWIGTYDGGLCRFNPQTNSFKRYPFIINQINTPNNNALDDSWVVSICEDKQGFLWLGTNAGGLNRLNRQSGIFTSYQNQLPGFSTITKIFEDSKKHLWAGTYIGGLFLFDRIINRAKKFTEKNGLLYDGVIGMNEDTSDNLWITSRRGISILNLQTNKFSHLVYDNGLPEEPEQYNTNFFKTSRGKFLIPCNNGFISFDPEQLKADTALPIVHIESLAFTKPKAKGNQQVDSTIYSYGKNNITLRYNENRITFNYVGLQYQNSALNQYAYKLDDYDNNWIQANTQRKVTYTNLSPGTYTFHVKAANSDGIWNPQEQTITVIILYPWWRTWWAYLLYAIIFLALFRSYIVFRSRLLRRQNKVLEEKVEHRTHQLSEANEELKTSQENIAAQRDELEQAVEELKTTQKQLIQSEKMASLGELTAGIAHEIQNPLNFVNNFSEVNNELIDEMNNENDVAEIKAIANDIKQNNEKIAFHGKRADAIVKNMLLHSRKNTGQKEPADINALCDEYLRLSYHGLRAKDKSFNADFKTDFDETLGKINVVPQDIGRVLLNLFNNAFYAVNEKQKTFKDSEDIAGLEPYKPLVSVQTKNINNKVEITINDNGGGIPQHVVDKIFQPFFTTKPTGEGTGLGLSMSYDIITKEHGGEIKVRTELHKGTEFIILLPVQVGQ